MSTPARKSSLSKLEAKQAELEAQIKDLRRAERRERLALERKRYAILGRVLAEELEENEALAAQLEPILNTRVTKPRERELLGLDAPAQEASGEAGQ